MSNWATKIKAKYLPSLIAFTAVFAFAFPAFAGCMSNKERLQDFLSNCVICHFVQLLLDACNSVITEAFNVLSGAGGPAVSLLALGLAFWMAWHIGQYFINYKYSDPMEFLSEIGRCWFRTFLIAAFLIVGTVGVVFDWIVSPIIAGFTDLVFGILNTDLVSFENMDNAVDYCAIAENEDPLVETSGKALSNQIIASFLCMVQAVYLEVAKGMTIGLAIQCYALGQWNFILFSLPDIGAWIIGSIIFLVFLFIAFAFSFRIVDFFLRIAFVLVLLPLLMVAWVFPITRKYTKKGWDLLLNSLVGILAVAIAMIIIVKLCGAALGESDRIDYYFNNDLMNDMYDYVYRSGVDFILFVAIMFISILLCKTCIAIANHFVPVAPDLGSSNIGASAGGKMAAAAARVAQAAVTLAKVAVIVATAGTAGVAFAGTTVAKEAVKQAAKKGVKAVMKTVGKMAAKVGKYAGNKAKELPGKALDKVKEKGDAADKENSGANGDQISQSRFQPKQTSIVDEMKAAAEAKSSGDKADGGKSGSGKSGGDKAGGGGGKGKGK